MKLLLDEMYTPRVAEQLRERGHDARSVHDKAYRRLEGAPDEDVFATAARDGRAIVTENVPDYRRLEADALARGGSTPLLILTTNRQFPRGDPGTTGRLVLALDALLREPPPRATALFLESG